MVGLIQLEAEVKVACCMVRTVEAGQDLLEAGGPLRGCGWSLSVADLIEDEGKSCQSYPT